MIFLNFHLDFNLSISILYHLNSLSRHEERVVNKRKTHLLIDFSIWIYLSIRLKLSFIVFLDFYSKILMGNFHLLLVFLGYIFEEWILTLFYFLLNFQLVISIETLCIDILVNIIIKFTRSEL